MVKNRLPVTHKGEYFSALWYWLRNFTRKQDNWLKTLKRAGNIYYCVSLLIIFFFDKTMKNEHLLAGMVLMEISFHALLILVCVHACACVVCVCVQANKRCNTAPSKQTRSDASSSVNSSVIQREPESIQNRDKRTYKIAQTKKKEAISIRNIKDHKGRQFWRYYRHFVLLLLEVAMHKRKHSHTHTDAHVKYIYATTP